MLQVPREIKSMHERVAETRLRTNIYNTPFTIHHQIFSLILLFSKNPVMIIITSAYNNDFTIPTNPVRNISGKALAGQKRLYNA